jgi:hypothetical protein
MARLEKWKLMEKTMGEGDLFPTWMFLQGELYEDDKVEDGTVICTSALAVFDPPRAVTQDCTYELGAMDPEFSKWLDSQALKAK